MTTITAAQCAALVKKVGFRQDEWVNMVAIAIAESELHVEAVNARSGASGIWQILPSAHPEFDVRRLRSDATYNAQAAYAVWKKQGARAWETFTSKGYLDYIPAARLGVSQAASVTGSPVLPGSGASTAGSSAAAANQDTQGPKLVYGPPGPQLVNAGVGTPVAAAAETGNPLAPLRIFGSQMWGDYSTLIIGRPAFDVGVETVPNLKFTIADPEGALLSAHSNVFVRGSRVQYLDLDFRIDSMRFEPGTHGTGQITVTAIDDIVYRLMALTGAATASGISATQWIALELNRVGVDPNVYFLGEAVVTQSEISRDVPDQQGSTTSVVAAANGWTTIVRLARELGKRVFVSGRRLVFGSSAFAMTWTAPGSLRLTRYAAFDQGEHWLSMPSAQMTSIGNRADVLEVTGKVPLNRAQYFRPGVSVLVFNTPGIAGDIPVQLMCAHAAYDLATDTDGADITLLAPVDPPVQPPQAANANKSDTSSGTLTSGGGADGQIDRFVAIALQQAGKRYVFGAEASPSDPNPKAFDCSELVEWAAARAGITPKVPDGSAAQQSWCASHKTLISAATAINTKGALLFMPGHVAISLGNGKTIEAMNPSQGVRQGNAAGRGWTSAGRIPGAAGYR